MNLSPKNTILNELYIKRITKINKILKLTLIKF